jgi:hypothetical protein
MVGSGGCTGGTQESVVELGVKGDQRKVANETPKLGQRFDKLNTIRLDHIIGDAGDLGDLLRHPLLRPDQCLECLMVFGVSIDADCADLDDLMLLRTKTSGLQVENNEPFR